VYPDRADQDRKLLVYASAPLQADLEITGSPVVTLEMSSTASETGVLLSPLHPSSALSEILQPMKNRWHRIIAEKR
jgi:uncharacterized protein